MEHQLPNRWIVLRLERDPSGSLIAGYEDDRGNRFDPHGLLFNREGRRRRTRSIANIDADEKSARFSGYTEFIHLVNLALQDLPTMREGVNANGPAPLAIFISTIPADYYFRDEFIKWLLPFTIDPDRIEIVRLAHHRWVRRPPFRLPLNVLSVGVRSDTALNSLRNAKWFRNDPFVKQYGIRLENVRLESAPAALRSAIRDIIIADESSVEIVLRAITNLPNPVLTRPRLVIFLGREESYQYAKSAIIPPGVSFLWVPLTEADYTQQLGGGELVKQFIYGITHDYPLHEVIRAVMRETEKATYLQHLSHYPLLIADPLSNNDVRISDAAAQLLDDAFTLNKTISLERATSIVGGSPSPFISYLEKTLERHADYRIYYDRETVAALDEHAQVIRRAMVEALDLSYNFQRETEGVAPLARVEAAVARAHESEKSFNAALGIVVRNTDYVEALQQQQERRVDVALQHLEGIPIYSPVAKYTSLKQNTRYRIRVHIGQQLHDSLVVDEVPSIDPLLPDPEDRQGYALEVVIVEDDFTLLSPRIQPLHLPLLGGSQPIYFEIRTPERTGSAKARLEIYYQNNLLQSFLLEAEVAPEEGQQAAVQVSVRLLFSRTARFNNLQELPPRPLSLGFNEKTGDSTHQFTMKSGKDGQAINLPQDVVSNELKKFRAILHEATVDDTNNPRFPTDVLPGTPPTPYFAEVVRKLADVGNELYRRVFKEVSREIQKEMRRLATSADETIQIIRYGANYAFPWNILYDFLIPEVDEEGALPPVCMGLKKEEGDTGQATADTSGVVACGHGPKDKVYCIWGFWGIRHCIEELVALGDSLKDAVRYIKASPDAPAVALMIGTPDANTAALEKDLKAALGSRFISLSPQHDLLQFLWEQDKRPAVLIVLGHMETTPQPPRIQLASASKQRWLSAKNIDDKFILDEGWEEQPNTLVLLMACSSGATEMTTVNDFVLSWTSVGAAGIVGTECLTFSRLVSRFARDVTCAMLTATPPKTLGDAVKDFNRQMIHAGNPLGFVFNCLGDADLTIIT